MFLVDRGMIDHRDYGDRHVGSHYVRIGHTEEQHECHEVSGTEQS